MTRREMESRRLQAVPDIQNGMRSCDLVRKYEITRTTIHRWRLALACGSDMKIRKALGRPRRLTPSQEARAVEIYYHGPREAGVDADSWTVREFTEVLCRLVGVAFSTDHMGRLMHRLGLPVGKRGSHGSRRRRAGGLSASTVNEPTHPAPLSFKEF